MSQNSTERRNELEKLWQEAFKLYGDNPQENLQISIKALSEHPCDKSFLFRAASAEECLADLETDDNEKKEHLNNSLQFVQRLIKEDSQSEVAKVLAVRVYSKLGLEDTAIERAHQCQNADLALKFCLKGDALRRHQQNIIDKKLHALLYEMSCQDLYLFDVAEKIVNIAIPDGNYQYYYHVLMGLYLKRANIYIQKGDKEAAVSTLKKLFEISKSTDNMFKKQNHFTTPLFDLLENNDSIREYLAGYVELFLISMERDFACLENNEEFKKILDDANNYIAEFSKTAVQKRKDEI